MTTLSISLDLLDGLIYSDVFDCALDLDEIHRFSRRRVERVGLKRFLESPEISPLLHSDGRFYSFADRPELASQREERIRHAKDLRRRAVFVAQLLRYVPFIRGILLTGSVAADDAYDESDVDLLLIVADRRLGLVFFILASLSRIVTRKVFCPNYYITESNLCLPQRDLYICHEIVQAKPLSGLAHKFFRVNDWVYENFPNMDPEQRFEKDPVPPMWLQRHLEWPLSGRIGDRLERYAQRVAHTRLGKHYHQHGKEIPVDVKNDLENQIQLRFHGSLAAWQIIQRYRRRRAKVATWLQSKGPQQPIKLDKLAHFKTRLT